MGSKIAKKKSYDFERSLNGIASTNEWVGTGRFDSRTEKVPSLKFAVSWSKYFDK